MNSYTMEDRMAVSDIGIKDTTCWLEWKPENIEVKNVEKDKRYQKVDIDLIWFYMKNGRKKFTTIEVKTDTYSRTGNYFIETVSNQGKNTKGCFLYSQADVLFYYFKDTNELNIIPLPLAQKWFLENEHRFVEKELKTKVGKDGYKSKGKLVPKAILNKEVPGVKTIILAEQIKIAG